jgi:hypothetical protein
VTIIWHDVREAIYSLLNDKELMHDDNLLFESDTPFPTATTTNARANVFQDVNDGSVYKQAIALYCKIPNRDVLCPLIFFIDRTHTDVNGNLCLEPVAMTLGIFNRTTRNKASAWRTLGYCINQSNCSSTTPLLKAQDFHAVLKIILHSLWMLQQTNGLAWELCYKGTIYNVVFKVPILYIIGDTEGHDKLVGKYSSRTPGVARLCRYCDCSFTNTDDPHYKFRYTKQSQIQKLVRENNVEGLKAISYRLLDNAWHSMQFCDPKRGIHGACPAEDMHVNRNGNQLRLIGGLLKSKKKLSRKRGRKWRTADCRRFYNRFT